MCSTPGRTPENNVVSTGTHSQEKFGYCRDSGSTTPGSAAAVSADVNNKNDAGPEDPLRHYINQYCDDQFYRRFASGCRHRQIKKQDFARKSCFSYICKCRRNDILYIPIARSTKKYPNVKNVATTTIGATFGIRSARVIL